MRGKTQSYKQSKNLLRKNQQPSNRWWNAIWRQVEKKKKCSKIVFTFSSFPLPQESAHCLPKGASARSWSPPSSSCSPCSTVGGHTPPAPHPACSTLAVAFNFASDPTSTLKLWACPASSPRLCCQLRWEGNGRLWLLTLWALGAVRGFAHFGILAAGCHLADWCQPSPIIPPRRGGLHFLYSREGHCCWCCGPSAMVLLGWQWMWGL